MNSTRRNGTRARLLAGAGALLLLAACESKEEQAVKFATSGQEYLESGDLDRAELQFNNALFKDPINTQALRGAAEIAARKDEPVRQSRMLARLLNELPEDVAANLAYARLSILGGAGDQALEHAERVLAQDPDNSEALTIKGAALVVDNKLAEAQGVLNQALAQDPDNAEIYNLLAAGDIRQDEFDKALATINKGIAEAENPETLLIVKLILAERVEGEEEVLRTFRQLIDAAPENGLYRQRLADYVLLKQRDYEQARALYEEALPLVTEKTPVYTRIVAIDRQLRGDRAAEATLRGFLEENADDAALKFSLPAFYCQTQQTEKCREAFRALAADETLPEEERQRATIRLADVHMASGEFDEAEALTESVLADDPQNVAGLTNKAQITLARGEAEEAIGLLRSALEGAPDNEEALIFLALAYEQTGQVQFADAQFAQAVDQVGYTKALSDQYRAFLGRRGEGQRAQQVLERYLAENPGDVDGVLARGQGELAEGDFGLALRTAESLIEQGAGGEQAVRLRVAALTGLERYDEALPIVEELAAASPDDRRLLSLRARLLSEEGRADEATALLRGRLGEGAEAADYGLVAEALMREEDYAGAAATARQAQERFPENEDAYVLGYLATKRAGDEAAALDTLRAAAARAESSVRSRTLLSNDLIVAGQMDEAVEVLRSLEADDALSDLTANNLASLLLERPGNEAEALRIAERFRRSTNPFFADTLAWAYYKNDRVEDAARLSRVAAEGAPENADVLYHRGVIAAAQGDTPTAQSNLDAARRNLRQGTQVSEADIDAALERL